MADGDVLQIVSGAFANVPVEDAVPKSANVPAVSTGALVLLSDVITAIGELRTSHNALLAALKAAGYMVPD